MEKPNGNGLSGEQRAISELLGTVIIIGIVVAGGLLVIYFSGGAVNEVEDESRLDAASQSLQQVESQFDDIRMGRTDGVKFSFPKEMTNRIKVEQSTRIALLANGNTSCTTGHMDLGTMIYEGDNGDTVGYEFGGVWRTSGGDSSTMVSPPQIEYRDGRIALSMTQIPSRFRASGGTVQAELNNTATNRMNELVSQALYSNKTVEELRQGPTTPVGQPRACNPNTISNVTMRIEDSPFASAWHQYGEENFDDELVSVSPASGSAVENGDTVVISFKLRNTASTEFVPDPIDAPVAVPGDEDIDIEATIKNIGDLRSTRNVTFRLYDNSGPTPTVVGAATETRETTLDGGQTVSYTFSVDEGNTAENTEYLYSIDTEDTTVNKTLQVGSNGADWPTFNVTSLSPPDNVTAGDDATLEAVIKNTGDLKGIQDVTFTFDGSDVATRTVELNGSEQTTLTFAIPTNSEGVFQAIVSSNDTSKSTSVSIGDAGVFTIGSPRSPVTVTASETFEINATISNVGERQETQTVDIQVQNVSHGTVLSSGSTSMTLNGSLRGAESAPFNHTVGGISDPGKYNYTIQTANATVSGNFVVGSSPTARLIVSSSTANPTPVEVNSTLDMLATVNNTGSASGTQTVDFYFDNTQVGSKSVSLSPGQGTVVSGISHHIPQSKPSGTYNFTVATANTTLTNDVRVVANLSSVIGNGSGGTITIDGNITARLTVMGTALTGNDWDWEYISGAWRKVGNYIIRGPTTMYVYTESANGTVKEHRFWGTTDLNTPIRRQDQMNDADYLSKTINVSSGSNLSVFGASHYCNGWQDSSIDRTISGYWGHFDSYQCADRGGERIAVDSSQNPSNIVILEDGDQVPSWGSASVDQRSVSDILGDKIYPSNGTLDLEATERVMLYELSEEDADPSNAGPGVSGDPDYNDAVVLFEVVNRTQTIDVKQPARFEITDVTAPSRVKSGQQADDGLAVTVKNIGERTNDTDINYDFDGTTVGSQNVNLTGGETATVLFDVPPTTSTSSGTHTYTVDVARNNQSRSGSVYVGNPPKTTFMIQGYNNTYPRTVKYGSSSTVDVTIANVGNSDGSQDVDIDWSHAPDVTKSGVHIDKGDQKSLSFDVPTGTAGTFRFTVSTENASSSRTIEIRNESFVINRLLVGADGYDDGETIVSTSLSNIRAEIENVGEVEGTQSVTFTLTNRSTGVDKSDSKSVTLDSGQIDLTQFGLGSWSNATGYYDYKVETDDDVQTGTIQIIHRKPQNQPESDSYIKVDMNVITFE